MNTHEEKTKAKSYDINLMDYWAVVLKRKWTVLSFAVPLLVIVIILSFAIKPTYTAKGTLLIEKEPNILSFEEILQIESFNDDYYQTQYKLLQSRSLADNVIEGQKLFENAKFTGRLKKNGQGAEGTDQKFRSKLIDGFLDRLEVNPILQTRLVEVKFKDHDPKFAANTLNALFDTFIDMSVETKYEATAQATEFLTGQIATLSAEIATNEQAMQTYGADKNIVVLSDKETTIIEKLGALNKALTEAQIERLNKETYYKAIKNVTPEYIPEALANPLIQRLREDYNKLSREYLKMQDRFKADYPELQRLKTELESARKSLEMEAQNLQKAAYSDWQAAYQREKSLESVFNGQKKEAIQLNSNAISYNQLKIELDNKKSLLENLLRRQSETGVSARLKGLKTSNIRVVDRAEAPLYPSSPKKKLNILLALLVGLFGGLGLAFLFESMDDSVKTFEDVEKSAGMSALGVVPALGPDGTEKRHQRRQMIKVKTAENKAGKKQREEKEKQRRRLAKRGDLGALAQEEKPIESEVKGENVETVPHEEQESIDLVTFVSPKSSIAESYRSIRTSLLLASADPRPKCIAVTSSLPQEGKTATVTNLAVTLAQAGKKVVIVDADLRKPRQHRIFKIRNMNGLTNFLTRQMEAKDLIKPTEVPNLFLINAGPVPPNPVELLDSEKMSSLIGALRQSFDYVLFDTPPILAVTDALDLGSKLDGVILVVWAEKTSRDALKQAREKLDMVKIRTLGVVLNKVVFRKHAYYYRHGYYGQYGEGR
jgi:polysaccharide biosynthesis transport protein